MKLESRRLGPTYPRIGLYQSPTAYYPVIPITEKDYRI